MKKVFMISSISKCCLMVWLICYALFSVHATSPAKRHNQTTKRAPTVPTNSQDKLLESLYDAHEWFKLRAAVQASDAPAFYRGAVAAAFNDFTKAENYLKLVIKSSPQSEQASDARLLLIQLYIRAGRYRQTLYEVKQALMNSPEDGGLKNARALRGSQPISRAVGRGASILKNPLQYERRQFVPSGGD